MPSISLALWKKFSPPSTESSPVLANSIGSTISQLSGVSHARTSGISLKLCRRTARYRRGKGVVHAGVNVRRCLSGYYYFEVIPSRLLPQGCHRTGFTSRLLRHIYFYCQYLNVNTSRILPHGYSLMVITSREFISRISHPGCFAARGTRADTHTHRKQTLSRNVSPLQYRRPLTQKLENWLTVLIRTVDQNHQCRCFSTTPFGLPRETHVES